MASFNDGILAGLYGKIGPITFYKRHDKTIGRIGRSDVRFKQTPLREIQQQKMTVVNRFTRAFSGTGFFTACYPADGGRGSGYNRATSLLLNQAVEGSYPNTHLNYANVLVSKGKLPPAVDAVVHAVVRVPTQHLNAVVRVSTQHILEVRFTNNSHTGTASPQDRVLLVTYAEAMGRAIFSLDAGRRADGQASLDVSALEGHAVETWIGFINADGSNVSDSVYFGRVVL